MNTTFRRMALSQSNKTSKKPIKIYLRHTEPVAETYCIRVFFMKTTDKAHLYFHRNNNVPWRWMLTKSLRFKFKSIWLQ